METVEFDRPMTESEPRLSLERMVALARAALEQPSQDILDDVDDEYYQLFLPTDNHETIK